MADFGQLEHELSEAKAEIARHHKDFGRIRELIEPWEFLCGTLSEHPLARALLDIRNVVG